VKRILLSLIGTLITVLVTLYVTDWYTNTQKQTEFSMSVASYDTAVHLTQNQIREILSAGRDINISLFEIVNSGSQPMTDQQLVIRTELYSSGSRILAVGSTVYPGDDEDGVITRIDGNKVVVSYRILNPGEKHRLWLVDNGLGLHSVTARRPGLTVSNIDREFNTPGFLSDPVNILIFGLIFTVVVFGFGAFMGFAGFADEVRKRGFSPEEIMKLEPDATLPPSAKGERKT